MLQFFESAGHRTPQKQFMSYSSMQSPIAIYLAGKISKNGWRHGIVPDLRSAWSGVCHDCADPEEISPIRFQLADTVLDYVGPYFAGCDHGCFHGPQSHGSIDEEKPVITPAGYGRARLRTFKLCLSWLRQAHVVFAHLESGDAQGSMFELGWAYGRLPVFMNFATRSLAAECWFAAQGADCVSVNPDPKAALLNFLPRLKLCRERN